MSRSREDVTTLLDWYAAKARPFIEKHAPGDLPAIDQQKLRAEHLLEIAAEEVAVCFLGAAGVGKSTLLNALVSERHNLLPHGGIGPLTAQATVVRYADAPYFRATYLPAQALNKILFALERSHELALKRATETHELAQILDEDDLRDAEAALPVFDPETPGEVVEATGGKVDAYQRQVSLLIHGSPHGEIDLPYLMDALRATLGHKPRWGRSLSPQDLPRIERLRDCLASAQNDGIHRERRADDLESFRSDLHDHASGFLAPLIKTLEVGWNAESLRGGLVLVDLPGVGVANDEYRNVTAEWIRYRARAIVLVVDRSGVTEASADLLRSTGFLNRLLHDSYDPAADPVALAVAVVKVDETARCAWQDERELRGISNARKWNLHFEEACDKAIELVRGQMRQELDKLVAGGPDATRQERQDALTRVLESMEVYPVSAPQYRMFHLQDEEDPPRIKSPQESRIPQFLGALRALAAGHHQRSHERAGSAITDLERHIRAVLGLVRAQWDENLRAEQEARQLSDELEAFLAPLQGELGRRQGAFHELLRASIPAQIEARVAEATLTAEADIIRYLRKLDKLHWGTLRATVRRGGSFVNQAGKKVDLPNDLALRFEEPVAVIWSKHILTLLRTRTSQLGKDYVAMVGEVVAWARNQNARVQPRFVDALHEKLTVQTKELSSVGKEALDELKRKVHGELHAKLVKRIRQRCEMFVEGKKDAGPGVKKRILELFHDELATGIMDIARPIAATVLLHNYKEVEREISERFAAYGNPLDAARDAIVSSHEEGVRRSDAQRRKRVLAELDGLLAEMPEARR